MIKYRATKHNGEIKKIEVKKETEKFVSLYNGSRVSKNSSYQSYFDKFSQAKEWLMSCCDIDISSLQRRLDQVKSEKQKVNNLNENNTK